MAWTFSLNYRLIMGIARRNLAFFVRDGNISGQWTVLLWVLDGDRECDNGDGRPPIKPYCAFSCR
jgi:hypothetical protein